MRLRQGYLGALLALIALLFVGCGGSSDNFVFNNTTAFGNPAALTFQTVPQRTAGQNFNVIKVAVVDSDGIVVANATNAITIALTNPGGATLSGTLTRNAVNGVACFDDLSVSLVGTYTFSATAPGLTGSQSQTFNITPAGSNTITFTQQPGNITEGTAFNPDMTVEVRDAFGNLVEATTVTVTIANDPSGTATLGGTTQATTNNGVATLTGLTINGGSGTGFTLQAAAGTAAVTSAAFDVAPLANRLFVSNFSGDSITVFDVNAAGDVAPLRTISGASTGIVSPRELALAGNEIFCVSQGSRAITVYPTTANGDVAPLRTISGPTTLFQAPIGIAVANNEIFVADLPAGTVSVFPQNGNGDIAPTRTITGLTFPASLAVNGNELFVTSRNRIDVFDVNANGAAVPVRSIAGANPGLDTEFGIGIAGNEIFVPSVVGGATSIQVFNLADNGDVAPQRTIVGAATTLGINFIDQLAISNGQLFVPKFTDNDVTVFNSNDAGNVAPQRNITGALTTLFRPAGIQIGSD